MEELLNNLFEGAYIVDVQRRILFWNAAAEKITGFKAEEVTGRFCQDDILDHRDEKGRKLCTREDLCPLLRALNSGRKVEEQVFLKRKDGTRLPVKVRVIPLEGGRAVEFFQPVQSADELGELVGRLEDSILKDPLLGIYNRKALEQELVKLISMKKRHGIESSIVFFDIDDFKQINDTYGHSVGDRVLTGIASTVSAMLRGSDFFARYGGEEFVVLMPATGLQEAVKAAERLKALIATIKVPIDSETIQFTVSAGVTGIKVDDTIESCLERADRLMYESKKLGKNRVTAS